MIRRTFAALAVSGAMLLGGVSAPTASAAVPRDLCSGIKNMANVDTTNLSRGKSLKTIDQLYASLQSKAPGKVKADIKYLRKYLKDFGNIKPNDPNYMKKLKKVDYKKLGKASSEFGTWATTYVTKKCGFDPNKLKTSTTG